jgi:phosphohistidine phosphatase
MAELIIMRHGKSDWEGGVSDRDRDLAPRGVKAARRVGRVLGALQLAPERVLVSSAVRTRRTLELAMEAGEWDSDVRILDELYLATESTVMEAVRTRGGGVRRLMVVGHEPFCSGMVGGLTGAACRFPTAAVALLEGPDDWTVWSRHGAVLHWFVTPRLLK